MSYEEKDNQVVLFIRDKASEKSPSYTGEGLVDGKKWQVALWRNVSKKGDVYLRLKFEEPWVNGHENHDSNDKEDIPF